MIRATILSILGSALLCLSVNALPEKAEVHLTKSDLFGFPTKLVIEKKIPKKPENLLREIASNTWGYFRDIVDKNTGLPLDNIRLAPNEKIGDYTSPTNIGLYIICIISAYDLGFIKKGAALNRITKTLNTVEKMQRHNGFLFNWYSLKPFKPSTDFISFVDSGWFTMALIIARQTFPEELGARCNKALDTRDFAFFYDTTNGQMRHGYHVQKDSYSEYHYGILCTESRAISLIAIGKNDAPKEHWFRIFRTLPKGWDWQKQVPKGGVKKYLGIDVFEGYYTYKDTKIVPSWGGSLFEFLMPSIFVKEKELAPKSLGLNDSLAVMIHIDYCLNKKKYPVWGMSPCCAPNGEYAEYGVGIIGSSGEGYQDGIVTPYATFLALEFMPEEAIENIKKLMSDYQIYGEYGFYDSVDPLTGEVSRSYLCLDQALILISLNNYLNKGIIRNRFHEDRIGQQIESLIGLEEFF